MSSRRASKDDLDDATFRARLAPLAETTLPRGAAPAHRRALQRGVPVLFGFIGGTVFFSAGWTYLHLQRSEMAAPTSEPPLASLTINLRPAPEIPTASALGTVGSMPQPVAAAHAPSSSDGPPVIIPSDDDFAGALLTRADAAIAAGDIAAARMLYERAAALGSFRAAIAVAKTYDSDFLRQVSAHGVAADPVLATAWYRKAALLGDKEASARLRQPEVRNRP
jgi:hypothetical protein